MKKIKYLVATIMISTFMITGPAVKAAPNDGHNFTKGKLSEKLTKDMSGVQKFFNDNKGKFEVENVENDLTKIDEKNDSLNFKHIKLQQIVQGIPVYGNQYIVHFNKNGEIYAVNGKFDSSAKNIKINKEKFISENKAIETAKSQVKFDTLEITPKAKSYIYKVNNEYIPVYEVRINFISPEPGDWHFFINAYNGQVVDKYNSITKVATTGTGAGVLGDTKTLNLDKVTVGSKTQYQMKDTTRGAQITTYNSKNTSAEPGTLIYSTTNVISDKAAVDAHYYAGVVYDYFKNKFNRSGIDGNNMAMKSSVHYLRNWVNAQWTGTQMMYGDGDGVKATALSGSLDVVGHEMTHGVDQYEANLTYRDQSGALNESLSDSFGTFIEFYAQPSKADWLLGEDVWTPNTPGDALRSMANPTLYGQPDNMKNYVYTSDDNGGVHTNSGIPNKACYLTATNPSVGVQKAEQIYYRALCNYLTSSSTFHDARSALAQSAEDLYGANSPEYNAVISAWDSVGVN
ncbi:M4 family metallopeptidase [Clostridium sp. OS1-26]|uniref:M4 family metallopeptidase n=1 Tax=Clostridium sp. OS1-26 TaxID=3070681 RepID=UPI0027E0413E|nr:M4 family metallopeptidase [Clostridium sp. OS1-26]WML37029.1 M4 family metallopeptidase [Clostridium sp. OS1-26]